MKNVALGILSIVVAIVFLAIGGEIAIRAVHLYSDYFSPQKINRVIALDDELGWLPVPNYQFSGELLDASGESYSVTIQTDSAGYRIFGNPLEKNRKKVLFIGDSFTHAMHVSNDKTYYELLKNALDIEVFALGVEGYGTLQQYMTIENIIDEIKPDIVVLQFCPNDFINNYYDLEMKSTANNNGLQRPYLIENEITYRTPSRFPALRNFANNHSQFLYFILSRIDRLNAGPTNSVERSIETVGISHPLFKQSVEITDQLVRKFKIRIPSTTAVYAFSSHHGLPYSNEFKRISEKNGIHFIDGPSQALRAAERNGITTTAADRQHWNNAGHQIVADTLQRYFEAHW